MRIKGIASLIIMICATQGLGAQTFLERLQSPQSGWGKITVSQSSSIDKLVNGKSATVGGSGQTGQGTSGTASGSSGTNRGETSSQTATTQSSNSGNLSQNDESEDQTSQESKKKVLANSYKVDGYRVQVYAGGNTKKDKQAAEKAGEDIKKNLPDQPIYVHFYSPRWICRIGNFRSYEEAHSILEQVRQLGYKQASIVKGKISVAY